MSKRFHEPSTSRDRDEEPRYIKKRAPGDMRVLELSDFEPPRPKQPHVQGQRNRKGRGAKSTDQAKRRGFINKKMTTELSEYFAMKINVADTYREAFSIAGRSGPVNQPDRVVEIETAGIRQVVQDCVTVARSKKDVFSADFEPALLHVTAYQVAAKLEHAHMRSPLGSTRYEQIPGDRAAVEHVRCAATTTFAGIAGYLDHVGNFMDDEATMTPYLRRLVYNDVKTEFVPEDVLIHHVPQLYSASYRNLFHVGEQLPANYHDVGIYDRIAEQEARLAPWRALATRIGIPLPDPAGPEVAGRDLVIDLRIVQENLARIQMKYPDVVAAVDVSTGKGSRSQHVAYSPVAGPEQNHVWSALPLDAMDLYVGAAFGFCQDRVHLPLPPEHHHRIIKKQMYISVPGSVFAWIKNLMLRG